MFSSLLIEASAGSGKTFQLSNRFLALLALGEKPADLIALTFTRKAAGEFSRRIFNRLAIGASSQEEAAKLAAEITPTLIGDTTSRQPGIVHVKQLPDLSMERFRQLLADLITALDQLKLSTLDSFFTRLVSSFSPELGLAGFEMLDEDGFALAREDALQAVLSGGSLTESQRDLFLSAFTVANYGNEEARVRDSILKFIEDYHEKLLQNNDGLAWGNAEAIWPDSDTWPSYSPTALCALQQEIESEIPETFGHKTFDKTFLNFTKAITEYTPGTPLPKQLSDNLFKWTKGASLNEPISFLYSRKEITFGLKTTRALLDLEELIRFSEIRTYLQRTKGIWAVVFAFENQYNQQVRSKGRVSFSDLTLLLEKHKVLEHEKGFNALSYRLDSQFKHWMLDEFQDTSRRQWSVIQPVIHDAMTDHEADHSLFVVGDTKQSIYGWRGGEPRLFDEIKRLDDWRNLHPWTMAQSWRSSAVVLDFVNLCCDPAGEGMSLFPEETRQRWNFEKHLAAKELPGEVAVYQLSSKSEGDELSEKQLAILAELERIQPTERNLSCAILVGSNKQVQEYTALLRAHSAWPVEAEAAVTIASDTPMGLALLDWFKFLAYPADQFARAHVSASPLASAIEQFGESAPEQLTSARSQISTKGVAVHLATLMDKFPAEIDLGEFQRLRLRQIIDAARSFDTKGGTLEEWLRMLKSQVHREESGQGAIQVMTVHKSKGLEFDVVILPELDGNSYDSVNRMSMLTKENANHLPEHFMLKPNKEIIQNDSQLDAQYQDWIAANCYERACNVYVALTRAAHALYLFLDQPSKSSNVLEKLNDAGWMHRTVGDVDSVDHDFGNEVIGQRLYYSGDQHWYEASKMTEGVSEETAQEIGLPKATPRAGRKTASSEKTEIFVNRYSRSSQGGKEFGNQIHALFELIETADDLAMLPNNSYAEHIRAAVSDAEGAFWFKPDTNTEVLREQAIEAVDSNGVWFSGVIDRAHIQRDANGVVQKIAILDYKTDRVESAEELTERYTGQLESYRHYLASAYRVPVDLVSTTLYSTALRCYILMLGFK
ncbi:UvrD-helicase domain-containing protein [Rubritalea sp.]|uniref:UvrD-helicase domain-containing protein n=1 Tax=Rubritalea sp. TaxID=2109375 RepID=UPI003EF8A668